MHIFKLNRLASLMLVAVFCRGAVPVVAFADDDGKGEPPVKPAAAAKIETPAPLTERERWMLDRMEQLEKRVAELEAKGNPPAAPAALASATQPASSTAIDPSSSATVAATSPETNVIPRSEEHTSELQSLTNLVC